MSTNLRVSEAKNSMETRRYRGISPPEALPPLCSVAGANATTGARLDFGSHIKNAHIQIQVRTNDNRTLPPLAPPSAYAPKAYMNCGAHDHILSPKSNHSDDFLPSLFVKREHHSNFSTSPSSPSFVSVDPRTSTSTSPWPSSDSGTGIDKVAEIAVEHSAEPATPVKRQRGRPRKGVTVPARSNPDSRAKGRRTKTGCLTCRQRKKKCDERKPTCSTCQSNNYRCEFPPKKVYIPGVKKSRSLSKHEETKEPWMLPTRIPEPPFSIYSGIETEHDEYFISYYRDAVCSVISVKGDCEAKNPFVSLIIPQAYRDEGTMHALLSLSSAHYYRSKPREDIQMYKERHQQKASSMLDRDFHDAFSKNANVHDGVVASLVLLFELNLIDCDFCGEYRRRHLQAQRYLVFRDAEPLQRFAKEYFDFRQMAMLMTSFVRDQRYLPSPIGLDGSFYLPPLLHEASTSSFFSEEFRFAVPETVISSAYDGVMRTVLGGLFPLISEITSLRDSVRSRLLADQHPFSSVKFFEKGTELEKLLHGWDSRQERQTEWWFLAELYREAALVYLFRTINEPEPNSILRTRFTRGICLLESLRNHGKSTDCVMLLPTFILGCAAFAPNERDSIETVMQALADCNNFSNIQPSMQVLRDLWVMMDRKDKRNWDWETIRERKFVKFDLVIT